MIYALSQLPNSCQKKSLPPLEYYIAIHELTKQAIAGAIFTAIKNKQILWVDELDSKFHPILFETIVRFFNSQKFNHIGAQLIFTTHDTQLLKERVLRRDQIYTVSKDEYGLSKIIGMHSTSLRIEASQEKEYLSGNERKLQKINLENVQFDLFGNAK